MLKLTKRIVESTQPDSQKPLKIWDSELRGFGLIILPSGRRTYCIEYRNINRIKKRFKLGVHGHITTEEARGLAKKYLGSIAHGNDPAEKKKENRDLPTINTLAQDYIVRHGVRKRTRSLKEDQKLLKNIILPSLGNKFVANISRRDIESLHLKHEKTPYQANRILALLSKMFSLAMSWGWRADNPVRGIERYTEGKRDRWLNEEEVKKLWSVLSSYPEHLTAFSFKLLLLTGARKSEVFHATWDQFDLEQGVWTKPSHLTKQKKKEHLPLSEQALEVLANLKELQKHASPYLFPNRVTGEPMQGGATFWKKILKEACLKNVRIHDLRHTYASHLVSSGLSLSIIGKLLGHTNPSTTQRYAHLADEPLRAAAELFGRKVGKLSSKDSS
ncbi:tyrosine-type recombinase/integrase [Candidatus Nucleicultrix amoebiphila]|uniref:Tyr recombinase domain-containing protein n=1 Tax=Candidatus Nucleicultrix amoebiphila FS5 TaxID=1414854 RepID=A0A1W6N4W2_9PROT|nr:site-specific integrase [Candidatus Nucleicultrix amoebiphila]ARN84796.1 hypothetical protein GQ61_05270 [Candidatus Nucleicultrix amoebiphila FS5]